MELLQKETGDDFCYLLEHLKVTKEVVDLMIPFINFSLVTFTTN